MMKEISAQYSIMCSNCIMKSWSENGQKKTMSEQQSYHVDDKCLFPSGAMLFKVLMNKAWVNN